MAIESKLPGEYFSAERRVRERRADLGDLELNEIALAGVKAVFKEKIAADIERHMEMAKWQIRRNYSQMGEAEWLRSASPERKRLAGFSPRNSNRICK